MNIDEHWIESCEKIFGGLFQYIKATFKNKMHPQITKIPFKTPSIAPISELNWDNIGTEKIEHDDLEIFLKIPINIPKTDDPITNLMEFNKKG